MNRHTCGSRVWMFGLGWTLAIALLGTLGTQVCAGPLASTDHAFFGAVNNEDGLQIGHDAGYWRGSQSLSGVSLTFDATVDFAVFAPGSSFGDFLDDEYGLADPTSGTEWVYAFQLSSDDTAFPDGEVTQLNAGYDPGEIVSGPGGSGPGQLPGETAILGGTATTSSLLQGSSSDWTWSGGLPVGAFSNILYYTSSFAPKKDKVTLLSGFDQVTSGPQDIASPSDVIDPEGEIPEPTSLYLLAIGLLVVSSKKLRRKHHC